MLKTIDNYQVEILITLALVMGGYQLASAWHLSGPLAMVVAGLMIGNQGRLLAMSDTTRHHLDLFWELIDEVLNALLFLLLGLEIFVLNWSGQAFSAGLILIFVVLGARMVAVTLPVIILRKTREFSPGVIRILTWGGLRGGISVALALALPKEGLEESGRQAILMATYLVVIFSIAVQGLTLRSVVDRLLKREVN
jgi:CPA1 family monovalent cation:H+ antiporter